MRRWLPWALALGIFLPGLPKTALPIRGVESYPKVAQIVHSVGVFTQAQLDTLSWYDLVVAQVGPSKMQQMRARNPHQKIFLLWMPQNIVQGPPDGSEAWVADTTWNIFNLCKFYADQNDWYLRDIYGERIPEWAGYAANWTRYCPRGTYGTSVGLTYAQWLIAVAIPQIMKGGPQTEWEPWGWDSPDYQGVMFEILMDCIGSWAGDRYELADPDQDGLPEGVSHPCPMGGSEDSLSILYREVNDDFGPGLYQALGDDFPFIINGANKYTNPAWQVDMTGIKIENWLTHEDWLDWWNWFYGHRDPGTGEFWGFGYSWAEQYVGHTGIDEIDGWDNSLLQVIYQPEWTQAMREQRKRFGLGTTMLGDGYFMYTRDQHYPLWQPEYDWDFGVPDGPFFKELPADTSFGAPDTLYVRLFSKGFVEVNPNDKELQGVPSEDTRFAWWQTLDDVHATSLGETQIQVDFTGAPEEPNPVDGYHLRYSTDPVTPENWEAATPYPGNPIHAASGAPASVVVQGLDPETVYYFGVKNEVYGRVEVGLSNVASAATYPDQGGVDSIPPSAILDVTSPGHGRDWVDLSWTATGDDGTEGTASAYHVRYRTGGAITTETQWQGAVPLDSLPPPQPAGSPESLHVEDLSPSTIYGFAVRAEDDVGLLSALSNPFAVTTAAAPDTTPPAAVDDLDTLSVEAEQVELTWTATGDDGHTGQAAAQSLRALPGRVILSEEDWAAAFPPADDPAPPGPPGSAQTHLFGGLEPDSLYGFAARIEDEAGNLSALSNSILVRTSPPPPPDLLPPAAVTDLTVELTSPRTATLRWTAVGDDSLDGIAAFYRIGVATGFLIDGPEGWAASDTTRVPAPDPAASGEPMSAQLPDLAPATFYGLAVRAYDESGNRSPLPPVPVSFETPEQPDSLPPTRVTDLTVAAVGDTWIELAWSAPADSETLAPAALYELRYRSDGPIRDETDWQAAAAAAGLPPPSAPRAAETFRVEPLEDGTLYALALRSVDLDGNRSAISNLVWAQTVAPSDTSGTDHEALPAPIWDLQVRARDDSGAVLSWTATGEDSLTGTAAAYDLRWLEAEPIATEADWDRARRVTDGLPAPAPAGAEQLFHLGGLDPFLAYGVCLRAVDSLGQLSPFVPGVLVDAVGAPPRVPPPPVEELSVVEVGARSASLRLRHPAPAPDGAALSFYVVGLATVPIDDTNWAVVGKLADPPRPGEPETEVTWSIGSLSPATRYYLAVRVRDAVGLWSPLSPVVNWRTDEEDLSPPVAPEALRSEWSEDGLTVRLDWDRSTDSRVTGYYLYVQGSESGWERVNPEPVTQNWYELERPDPHTARRASVSAVLSSGAESALSSPISLFQEAWTVEGPFPHPVGDECRIRVSIPWYFPENATLRGEILSLTGELVRVLFDGPVDPGRELEWTWDRRNRDGERSAPGFYYLRIEGGGRKTLKRIYLSP